MTTPRILVPRLASGWERAAVAGPFLPASGSGAARQGTIARLFHDGSALRVRFECEDDDAWGTLLRRDDPLYEEEAVELFVASGEAVPASYYEFEVSPLGTLFDARVRNPHARRSDMLVEVAWNGAGVVARAGIERDARRWWAELTVPLATIAATPHVLRANLFRIDRPKDRPPEFTCWSPTLTEPADFHKPAAFGVLELEA